VGHVFYDTLSITLVVSGWPITISGVVCTDGLFQCAVVDVDCSCENAVVPVSWGLSIPAGLRRLVYF
jgi:hypothetical protein